jgi:hypothetical protein
MLLNTVLRHVERLKPPQHFQDRLTRAGGINRYGQPLFRLAWAQTETTRQGGQWEAHGEWFKGYRDVLLGDGLPHWMLLQWADAGKSIQMPTLHPESDGAWYDANKCPVTGLSLLGGYPYQGSYQIALQLRAKWFEKDARGNPILRLHAFPLSTQIIDMMVPIIKATREVSMKAKLMSMDEDKEKDEVEYAKTVEDVYQDAKLSASARSSKWIQDKARSIESAWNAALVLKLQQGSSFAQGRI